MRRASRKKDGAHLILAAGARLEEFLGENPHTRGTGTFIDLLL
jgi:hypothetical protein